MFFGAHHTRGPDSVRPIEYRLLHLATPNKSAFGRQLCQSLPLSRRNTLRSRRSSAKADAPYVLWNLFKRREKSPLVSRRAGFGACFVEGFGASAFRSARLAVSVAKITQACGLNKAGLAGFGNSSSLCVMTMSSVLLASCSRWSAWRTVSMRIENFVAAMR